MYGFLLLFYSNVVSKTHHFLDIRRKKCCDLEIRVRGPSRSLKISQFNRAHFIFTFYTNHGPVSYRFRDRRRFQSKIAKFSHPRVCCAPDEGVPLQLGTSAWGQKLESWATVPRKKFDDTFSRVDTIHQRDRRTPGDSKDRAYALRCAVKDARSDSFHHW